MLSGVKDMYQRAYLYAADCLPGKMIASYLLKRGLILTDGSQEATVEDLERAVTAMGGLDLYIHAGQWEDELAELQGQPESFVHHVEERLRHLFVFCQAAARIMAKQKRGQIIIPLLADGLHSAGFPSSPVYNQGAISFAKSLAKELSPFGISVNVLEFGYFQDDSSRRKGRKRFDVFALKPPAPSLAEAVEGLGILLDYGKGMSGQVIQWGYGTPSTTL